MQNRITTKFDNIVKVKIEGININNYIKRLLKKKINIIKLIPISYKEVHLIITIKEYEKLIKYKSIYTITIIDRYGQAKLKVKFKKNLILLSALTLGLVLIILLSNVIFSIDIIHEDKEIRDLLKTSLANNGIKKYTLKKDYNTLEKIEENILNTNKDKLEWIEIIESGTKYIVRTEERKINKTKKNHQYQNIVAKKNAVITKIKAYQGEKVKVVNDYVKKGDVIISGYITHPDNTQTPTMAKGVVYGEVWYKISLNYPFVYQEEKLTGATKTIYVLNFLNKRLSIFDFKKYKSFKSKDKILLSNSLSNISLIKEKQYELKVKDEVYPEDIAITKAKDYIKTKLKKDNPNIKKIKDITITHQEENEQTLDLSLFITAIENIGAVSKIDPQANQNITNSN